MKKSILLYTLWLCVLGVSSTHAARYRYPVDDADVLDAAKPFTSVVNIRTPGRGYGSGVIIGPRTVLTAASLVRRFSAKTLKVRAEDEHGVSTTYKVLFATFPESRNSLGKGSRFYGVEKNLAVLILTTSIDTDRFDIASVDLDGTYFPRCEWETFDTSSEAVFKGVGYGDFGKAGKPSTKNDGHRRYYEATGRFRASPIGTDMDGMDHKPDDVLLGLVSYLYDGGLYNYDGGSHALPFEGMPYYGDVGSPVFYEDPVSGEHYVVAITFEAVDLGSFPRGTLNRFLMELYFYFRGTCDDTVACSSYERHFRASITSGKSLMLDTPVAPHAAWIRNTHAFIETYSLK